jgi:hypothetical protein
MYNLSAILFEIVDATLPFHIIFTKIGASESACNVRDAVRNFLIICGKIHATRPKCPGAQTDVCRNPLVAFWSVTDSQNV